MRLTGQPESELLVWRQQLELLLKAWQPRGDQMQVLEADPFSLRGSTLDKLEGDLVLATTHGELVEALPSHDRLCEVLELTAGIRSWRDDEEDGLQGSGLVLVDVT